MSTENTDPTARPEVHADAHGLSVAATATLDWAVAQLGADPADTLTEAWEDPAYLLIAGSARAPSAIGLPSTGAWPSGYWILDRTSPAAFAADLADQARASGTETIWDEVSGPGFLDDPRRVSHLELGVPIELVTAFGSTDGTDDDEPDIVGRYRIRPGHYLVAETIGRAGTRVALHGFWAVPTEVTLEALADIEGFDAWTVEADCSTCHRSWSAFYGSDRFVPQPGVPALEWHYRDATGHEDNTVDCPAIRCSGRVAFTI
ncbi:hypothetical protein [Glycomyces tenuis]|uniref:hypothetical protein n=1 Tax=Glycomyces tenuis TaxID=58116 RepID=UPI00040340FE|nr:hypothetical protein [Glycomyces tenuis]